jgi:glycerol-3-phosphate dehydrogenase
MIPKTADGRVLFAIPWHGATHRWNNGCTCRAGRCRTKGNELGKKVSAESYRPLSSSARRSAEEILSVWSGLRPLVRKGHVKSSKLSRDHTILVSPSGLVTVTGGKWTTYRRMGQDTIDRASVVASLPRQPSRTLEMKLHGWTLDQGTASCEWEQVYGSDLPMVAGALDQMQTSVRLMRSSSAPSVPACARLLWAARS